jgi:hypothetical protein
MHAIVEYALINQRTPLIKMQRRRTNETRLKGPEGALLFLRATSKVRKGKRGNKFPSEALY